MQKNKSNQSSTSAVSVLQRKKYGFLSKIFCCKCVHCCQSLDFSLLTSENRRGVFFTMINNYVKSIQNQPNIIIDPFFILLGLLLGEEDQQINTTTLMEMGDSKERQSIFSKQDLELYIPQLCTYLVFHEEMANIPIFTLLERTARFDIQFALLYYSYMRSLEIINENTQFKVVMKYNKTFKRKIDQHFKFVGDKGEPNFMASLYNNRGENCKLNLLSLQKLADKPHKKLYYPCLEHNYNEQECGIFGSSLNFLHDLITLGLNLLKSSDRKTTLSQSLQQMNKKLPAEVYLPFKDPAYKFLKVASIVFQQSRVFSTKMRAPYYICLQLFEEKLDVEPGKYKRIVSTARMNQSQLKKSHLFQQDTDEHELQIVQKKETKSKPTTKKGLIQKVYRLAKGARNLYRVKRIKEDDLNGTDINFQNQEQEPTEEEQQTLNLFGQTQANQEKRIKTLSPFSELPNYRLVHFMIKTLDDLRQQAFAMQLLEQFNQIFSMQGLPIHVVPYQVIPLGHNCGIIEYLKDSLTIDQLRKREGNLQFIKKDPLKYKNFLNTLVGYCLTTYFLQVKDRHNGNIMIRIDGSLIHIDFGFFMSNAPGKGVELEKKVAFKMTHQYINTLGGLDSKGFSQFRKLFYRGYQACRKHQHRILILVKLMYSSHGTTMPCFEKGNIAIEDLENRLNPRGIRTDGDLSLYCQNLINTSIDNWRARWYDKWQYYMQGILY